MALPAGRFLVIRRRGERPSAVEVDLAWGGGRRVLDSEFRALAREELAARGGQVELLPWHAGVRAAFESLVTGATPAGFAVGLEAARGMGRLVLAADLGFCGAPVETPGFGGWRNAVAIGASVGLRGHAGPLQLTGALGGQLRVTWEGLSRPEAARFEAAGLPSHEEHSWLAGGPRASLEVALPLGHQLDIAALAGVTALVQRDLTADGGGYTLEVRPLVITGLALRRRF